MNGQAAVKKAQTCFQFSQEIFIVDLKKSFFAKMGGVQQWFYGNIMVVYVYNNLDISWYEMWDSPKIATR